MVRGSGNARKPRKLMASDWIPYQHVLEHLYLEQGKALWEVSQTMLNTYGFSATRRQYIHRFEKWGFRKYKTAQSEGKKTPSILKRSPSLKPGRWMPTVQQVTTSPMAADRLTSTPGGPYFTNNALDAEILSQALASVPASHDSGPMTLTIPVGTPSSASETPVISSGSIYPAIPNPYLIDSCLQGWHSGFVTSSLSFASPSTPSTPEYPVTYETFHYAWPDMNSGEAPSLDTDIFYSGVNDGHEVVSNYPLGWEANSLGYGFG